jgi:monoamine oxidase
VILAFSRPFWPEGFFDVVCPSCLIPEFWVTSYPASGDARAAGLVCMTGFVAGAAAEELSSWPQTHLVFKALAQLDEMFGAQSY